MRLNIGAGDKVLEGWLSVGLAEHHDIRTDIRALPLPDDSVDAALAVHVVEHIQRWEVPAMLRDWYRVLKPGAVLVIEQPELLRCCRAVLADAEPRNGIWGLYGDPGYRDPLMTHKWAWTVRELCQELRAAGFRKLRETAPQFHGKRKHRDMRIEATK
jgi:predicted SAM-dependent methyltransferase